uniref:ATP synthase F0 subunit 6 n=1 Tax=Tricentrus fulgidus TaxID=3021818 RepID=UPI00237A9FD9|nr:ATP synthase F0 subunit 6 [Tricentrus fulgidus]WBV77306.1 ATP synthase F0 subunit 6 [Tricentrus fulgidus]
MLNLFSTFDPCTGMMSLNWLSSLTMMLMMNYSFWTSMNNYMNFIMKITLLIKKELKMILKEKGSSIIFISISMFILINNMMGLLPYIFTSSSHLSFSLAMALPMWMSFMVYGWTKKTNSMFTHLLPNGTPMMLMPFMVMIETISNMIRPGSLAVRLTSNMIAGHLLMSLLGNSCSLMKTLIIMMTFIMLMMFETAVSLIQSYVFMILTTLYSSEI